jgi:intein-encoded DNA endonuclease-like protein
MNNKSLMEALEELQKRIEEINLPIIDLSSIIKLGEKLSEIGEILRANNLSIYKFSNINISAKTGASVPDYSKNFYRPNISYNQDHSIIYLN